MSGIVIAIATVSPSISAIMNQSLEIISRISMAYWSRSGLVYGVKPQFCDQAAL